MIGPGRFRVAVLCFSALLALAHVSSQSRFASFSDIQPIVTAVSVAAPDALQGRVFTAASWPDWIKGRDAEIRARLAQGDDDTLINWLLLGRGFTARPPVLLDASAATDDQALRQMAVLIGGRLNDLLRAAAAPGTDERRLFASEVLRGHGFDVTTAAGAAAASGYLLNGVGRIIDEWTRLRREPTPQFVERGLSLDTSLQPNYAIERTLAALKANGTIMPRSVGRVAVVGAGLDFADKNTGFDFYPVQSVQPFAVLDSLRRLDLARPAAEIEIVALDISPRIVNHLTRMRAQARQGGPYTIHLPLDARRTWAPDVRAYWQSFGSQIGREVMPQGRAPVTEAAVRAISVAPVSAARISALDLNIITERRDDQRFDLIIATNVLIYYNAFEQAMAFANAAAMLQPRGLLLTNDAMPAGAGMPLRRGGSQAVVYSGDNVGDRIEWYIK